MYLKNKGMDVRVYSLASVLNVLFVMFGNLPLKVSRGRT